MRKIASTSDKKRQRIKDWAFADGAQADIVQFGKTVATGIVDGVTNDGAMIWVKDASGRRRLYERCEFFEVWVPRDLVGLQYKIIRADS